MVEGGGFEPPKSSDDRFTVCSLWPLGNPSRRRTSKKPFSGAGDGTRTRNLLITSQLLYQLSYASAKNLYIHDYRNRVKQQKSGITLITNHAFCVKRFLYTIYPAGE